jgi:hypothetical protein
MNGLLDTRMDGLDTRRIEIIVVSAVLVLLIVAVALVAGIGRRRRITRPMSDELAEPLPDSPDPFARSHLDPASPYGAGTGPNRRERSGALR